MCSYTSTSNRPFTLAALKSAIFFYYKKMALLICDKYLIKFCVMNEISQIIISKLVHQYISDHRISKEKYMLPKNQHPQSRLHAFISLDVSFFTIHPAIHHRNITPVYTTVGLHKKCSLNIQMQQWITFLSRRMPDNRNVYFLKRSMAYFL